MSFVDEMKKALSGKRRDPEDDETDLDELRGAGVSVAKGDARLKGGIRRSNMSTAERSLVDAYRRAK